MGRPLPLEKVSGGEGAFEQLDRAGQLEGSGTQLNPPQPHLPAVKPSRQMYKRAADAPKVFSFLDRGGALASVGPSSRPRIAGRPPIPGTFGVSIKKADDACGGVTNADLKTTQEEYRAPIARKKLASRLRQAVTFVEGHHGGRDALNMMLGNQRIGKVTFKSPGVIGSTEIDEGFRGLGLGRKMYGEAARRAPGGRLISDGSVSPEAQNVWQSMMRRPAHGVETKPHEWTRPTTRALESGEKVPAVRWSAPMDKATPSEGLYSTQLPAKAVMSKVGFEKMDEESWKQTLRDIPLVILATGLGWGVGKTVSGALGEHLAREGVKPAWTKHIPAATALLSSLGSYAMGRSRAEMARRREEARSAADPTVQVGEKLASEFSYYVGKRLAGGHP